MARPLMELGRSLGTPKMFLPVVYWDFHQGRPFIRELQPKLQMKIKDPKGKAISIEQLSPYTARKTVGHFKGPGQSVTQAANDIQTKSKQHAIFLKQSNLNPYEAWTYYFAIYLPSIGYTLPNTSFTETELLEGPSELGGAGFRNLYTEQG
eukprot:CAMPEP_0178935298 /NCGR_PEP_ID=MMETSP0786-20121207/24442_1 /TAXON_ID=186022 /ORGANISM="Thalassionema frauenfeldii, Strain CCMP 1798" /LENGTH=150 /DNA_ID=CAMNT_0020613379 /DNA_START=136 /DNA_END=585 /DNA_ORIENTATION=-